MVLDSGVGGLSIVARIRALCPPLQIHYLADLAGFPYGIKSEQEVTARVVGLVEKHLPLYQPLIVIIACNTASTVVLDELRRRFSLPFIGVVPAVKPAAQLTQSGVIGVLATEGTINREYTHNLIQQFAPNQQVLRHGSAGLVLMAEAKLKGQYPEVHAVRSELAPLLTQAENMDTIVLACTHFPLLKEELIMALPQVKFWVDSGDAIARRVNYWINELNVDIESLQAHPVNTFLFNGKADFAYEAASVDKLLGNFQAQRVAD